LAFYYRVRDKIFPNNRLRRLFYELLLDLFFPTSFRRYFPTLHFRLKAFFRFFSPAAVHRFSADPAYQAWLILNEPDEETLQAQRRKVFSRRPKISIVVPLFKTPLPFLKEMVDSVRRQSYRHWQLCLAVGGPLPGPSKTFLRNTALLDSRISVCFLPRNLGIVGNSNAALALAKGEFLTFLDHDDCLPPYALFEVVQAINREPGADFFYSDEDKISADGKMRGDPHFKPDFSPDTLRSCNYISHLSVVKKSLLQEVGEFHAGLDGGQDYDLILRLTERARKIVHIPKVLYHWRAHQTSTAAKTSIKKYALTATRQALQAHLRRIQLPGCVLPGHMPTTYRVRQKLAGFPKVSIIIPNRDQADVLGVCLDSILKKTTYPNYEIAVVENGSTEPAVYRLYHQMQKYPQVRLLHWTGAFHYSAVNNFAVRKVDGELLLFLNNDMEVINGDWLTSMVELAARPEVGVVGAKLFYPDSRIQHGGVIVGLGGVAGHSHKHFPKNHPGYFGRLQIIQNFSAVTGACMLVKRSLFDKVRGFDLHYPLAFNDVDLCLKIREKGYLVVWTPYAQLFHYESKTRGFEDSPEKMRRFQREMHFFQRRWKRLLAKGDPYYNPNLTLDREDFTLAV
jgi:GT2 family glycosyltransferase